MLVLASALLDGTPMKAHGWPVALGEDSLDAAFAFAARCGAAAFHYYQAGDRRGGIMYMFDGVTAITRRGPSRRCV